MVKPKPSPSTQPAAAPNAHEEFKKLRMAELDEAYRKQLRSLASMVRATRLNLRRPRRP